MNIDGELTDNAILRELGARIARCRLNRNMTQAHLAEQAGVSRPTVQRLENGASTQLTNLVRVLRALHLTSNLDSLVPARVASPIQQARMAGKQRQRASSQRRGTDERKAVWTWETDS